MATWKRSLGTTSPARMLIGAGIYRAGMTLLATEVLHLFAQGQRRP